MDAIKEGKLMKNNILDVKGSERSIRIGNSKIEEAEITEDTRKLNGLHQKLYDAIVGSTPLDAITTIIDLLAYLILNFVDEEDREKFFDLFVKDLRKVNERYISLKRE